MRLALSVLADPPGPRFKGVQFRVGVNVQRLTTDELKKKKDEETKSSGKAGEAEFLEKWAKTRDVYIDKTSIPPPPPKEGKGGGDDGGGRGVTLPKGEEKIPQLAGPFGSKSVARNDLGNHISAGRTKELMRRELRVTDRVVAAAAAALETRTSTSAVGSSPTLSASGSAAVAASPASSTAAASGTGKWGPSRRLGSLSVTSNDIGWGMDSIKLRRAEHAIHSSVRQFMNIGHLGGPEE